MGSTKNRIKQLIAPTLTFVLFIGLWQLVDYLFDINNIILPNPFEIFVSILNNFSYLLDHTMITFFEAVSGFILGGVLAFMCGVVFTYSRLMKKSFYPYAIAFKAVPVIALAPLLVMWFGSGIWSKIVMASIICYFPVLIGTVKGLSAVTQEHLDLFNVMSSSRWNCFLKLRLPVALPYLFPALKISATFSIVGATIAEFTGASRGIGYIIVNSSYYLETIMMFGAIVMISITGLLLFYLVDYLEKKILFWEEREGG
ncbi:ABC transporter permease [Candidatus Woesearchaeota archaeon]|jgi:NitT/TauT family transport system permease protein|nr:ABC transporter permease [Candidatus Woesearchaeota archaeon]MBT6520009.1 ABC transporter permease [Candidatus Woesearchaeota archaeon]MBT7367744.1 ABC transporter permease [Candidatus Woesearchaeota archaeon]